jgi:hypothetical protein
MKLLKTIIRLFFFAFIVSANQSCTVRSALGVTVRDAAVPLAALNKNARSGSIDEPDAAPYLCFAFPRKAFEEAHAAFPQALEIELAFVADGAARGGDFAFGFLFPADFDRRGAKLAPHDELALHPAARGCVEDALVSAGGNRCRLSLAFPKGAALPRGFFVHSTAPVTVRSVAVISAALGWKRGAVPRFFFPHMGGTVPRLPPESASVNEFAAIDRAASGDERLSADFSGATELFAALPPDSAPPAVTVGLVAPADWGVESAQKTLALTVRGAQGSARFAIRRAPGQTEASVPAGALGEIPLAAEIAAGTHGANSVREVTSLLLALPRNAGGTNAALPPLAADPGLILGWDEQNWRRQDFELFEWAQFPGILFFDTRDYLVQDSLFKRLAFFAEKKGYRGHLVTDEEVAGLHGFNAHDYRADTLAAFFSRAETERFPLSERECLLRSVLLDAGIIRPTAGGTGYSAGEGAVISLSKESPERLRRLFAAHEGLHGLFFTQPAFRAEVARAYAETDRASVAFLERYFDATPELAYDVLDRYLVQNEFMAYLLQQPAADAAAYMADTLAAQRYVNRAAPELARQVRETGGQGFAAPATALSAYLFQTWGLAAGRTWLISGVRR